MALARSPRATAVMDQHEAAVRDLTAGLARSLDRWSARLDALTAALDEIADRGGTPEEAAVALRSATGEGGQ